MPRQARLDAPWAVYSRVTEGAELYLSEDNDLSLATRNSYLVPRNLSLHSALRPFSVQTPGDPPESER